MQGAKAEFSGSDGDLASPSQNQELSLSKGEFKPFRYFKPNPVAAFSDGWA